MDKQTQKYQPNKTEIFLRRLLKNKFEILILCLLSFSLFFKYALPEPYFGNNRIFLEDDLFYYFTIAKNFYVYYAFTFDGLVSTNGFHPLWQLILTVLYGILLLLGQETFFQYYAVALNALFYLFSALLFYRILLRYFDTLFSFFTTTIIFMISERYFVNGMETVLVLLTTELTFLYLLIHMDKKLPINTLFFAFLTTLVVLSRLDAIALIGPIFFLLWFFYDKRTYLKSFTYFSGFVTLFLILNYSFHHTLLLISGKVKSFWGSLLGRDIHESWIYLTDVVKGYFYHLFDPLLLPHIKSIDYFLLAVSVICLTRLGFIIKNKKELLITFRLPLIFLSSILIYFIAQLVYYSFFSAYIWRWYQGTGILFLYFIIFLTLFHIPKLPKQLKIFLYSAVFFSTLLFDYTHTQHGVNQIKKNETWGKVSLRTTEWIEKNTNKQDIIGMWAAGEVGFYSDRRIVNLEGLVGNREMLEHNKNDTLIDYIESKKIDYIIQWFPISLYNATTQTIGPSKNVLLDLRTRLLYKNPGKFDLLDTIRIQDKLRFYMVYIFKRIDK